jgi:tetratricopeptide (TPR) repeat protein
MATTARSEQYLLLAELGFAKIAIERGNLPAAAGMLDRILDDARTDQQSGVRSKALLDRARVASQLGDYTSAAILGHEALICTNDPMDRDRILLDIGNTLTQLGMWDEARDAFLVAGATAQEAAVRWMSQINLMEIAYLDGNELMFEHCQRAVSDLALPPYIETVYYETRAHGLCVFGRTDEGAAAFRRMLDVAKRFGLNDFVRKAERALEDIFSVRPPVATIKRREMEKEPTQLTAVADSLSKMRELAGL